MLDVFRSREQDSETTQLRRLKQHQCYTAPELAALLKVNLGTVRRWSMEGLRPIERRRPFLFLGKHVADFLRGRRPPPIKLAPGELLCVRCNAARFPGNFTVRLIPRGPTTVDFAGLCGTCGCGMLRRSRISEIEQNLGPSRVACGDDQTTISSDREPHQMSLFEDIGQ